MTRSSTQGIQTVLQPVSDLATAKAAHAALAPAMDSERASADDFLLGGVGHGKSLHRRQR